MAVFVDGASKEGFRVEWDPMDSDPIGLLSLKEKY